MAIRLISEADIRCEICQKVFGTMRASRQIFDVLKEESRYLETWCLECKKVSPSSNIPK